MKNKNKKKGLREHTLLNFYNQRYRAYVWTIYTPTPYTLYIVCRIWMHTMMHMNVHDVEREKKKRRKSIKIKTKVKKPSSLILTRETKHDVSAVILQFVVCCTYFTYTYIQRYAHRCTVPSFLMTMKFLSPYLPIYLYRF